MHVRVLGAAAGGGFPQWNCSCNNCRKLRQGTLRATARSQAQLAISADFKSWFLINASPDLRYQIESFSGLHPSSAYARHSPIAGVVLTSAEVDACLGLLLLRESQPIEVYSARSVKSLLMDDNNVFQVLKRQANQVTWHPIVPNKRFNLGDSGIQCLPISTEAAFPGHVSNGRANSLDLTEAVLGFFIEHDGSQIAFFPGVHHIKNEWLAEFANCAAIFIDGTFWSDDELIRIQGGGKTARQMGHSPISGADGTIERLSGLVGPKKVFIHINNTNPMLDEDSPEYCHVIDSGWQLAFDGMELTL